MTEHGSCCRCKCVKKEDFGLNWKDPHDFARSQWPIPGWSYQVYRVLFMVYIVVWLTLNTAWKIELSGGLYFIYLTNWSFIVLGVYAIVAALSSVIFFCRSGKKQRLTTDVSPAEDCIVNTSFDHDIQKAPSTSTKHLDFNHNGTQSANEEPISNPWYFRLTWILLNINIAIAPLVSVVYWGLLHDFGNDDGGPRDPLGNGINVNVHGMNSVLIVLDLFVSAYPIRISHIIYGIIYALAYIVFSLIYWGAGGIDPSGNKYIYSILNWGDIPGLTCAFVLAFTVVMFVAQCLMYCLYRLRMYLAGKCCNTKETQDRRSKAVPLETIVV